MHKRQGKRNISNSTQTEVGELSGEHNSAQTEVRDPSGEGAETNMVKKEHTHT